MADQGSYVELAPEWDDDGWFKFPRAFIRDQRLSWEARAVAAWMASHKTARDGEPFRFDVAYIVRSGPAGRDKIRGVLRELESLGYLDRQREREQGLYGPIKHVLHPVPLTTERRSEFSTQVTSSVASSVSSVASSATSSVKVQQNRRSRPAPENPAPVYPATDFQGGQEREHEIQRDASIDPPTPPDPQPTPDAEPEAAPEEEGGKEGSTDDATEIPREVWDMLAGITIPAGKRAPGRRSTKLVQVATRCAVILQHSDTYGLRLDDLREHLATDLDTVRHSIVGCWLHRLTDDELPYPRMTPKRTQSNTERREELRARERAIDARIAAQDDTQPQQRHDEHQARHAQRDMAAIRAIAFNRTTRTDTSPHYQNSAG